MNNSTLLQRSRAASDRVLACPHQQRPRAVPTADAQSQSRHCHRSIRNVENATGTSSYILMVQAFLYCVTDSFFYL